MFTKVKNIPINYYFRVQIFKTGLLEKIITIFGIFIICDQPACDPCISSGAELFLYPAN